MRMKSRFCHEAQYTGTRSLLMRWRHMQSFINNIQGKPHYILLSLYRESSSLSSSIAANTNAVHLNTHVLLGRRAFSQSKINTEQINVITNSSSSSKSTLHYHSNTEKNNEFQENENNTDQSESSQVENNDRASHFESVNNKKNNNTCDDSESEQRLTVIVNEIVEILQRNGPLPISRLSSQLDAELMEAISEYKGGLTEVCAMYEDAFVVETLAGGIRVVTLRGVIDVVVAGELQRNYYNRLRYNINRTVKSKVAASSINNKLANSEQNVNVTDADKALLSRLVALFTAAMYFPRKVSNGLPSSAPHIQEIYQCLRRIIQDDMQNSHKSNLSKEEEKEQEMSSEEESSSSSSSLFSTYRNVNTSNSSQYKPLLTLATLGTEEEFGRKLLSCPTLFDVNQKNGRVKFNRRVNVSTFQTEIVTKRPKRASVVTKYEFESRTIQALMNKDVSTKPEPRLAIKFQKGRLSQLPLTLNNNDDVECNKMSENRLLRTLREVVPSTFYIPLQHMMSDKRAYLYFDVKDTFEAITNELRRSGKNIIDVRMFSYIVHEATTPLEKKLKNNNSESNEIESGTEYNASKVNTLSSSSSLPSESSENLQRVKQREEKESFKNNQEPEMSKLQVSNHVQTEEIKQRKETVVFIRLIDSSTSTNMLARDRGELELNCLQYNIFSLGERIIREFRNKLHEEPQLRLKCIKGIAMNHLPHILSPLLINDLIHFFTSRLLASHHRYEEHLHLQLRQQEDKLVNSSLETEHKELKEELHQQRVNRENCIEDIENNSCDSKEKLNVTIDHAMFILIFDRLRHEFDVNFNKNSVRPWSVLPETDQFISLTTETTPLPLVLRAIRLLLTDEPLTPEQLFHSISHFCRVELLALFDNSKWIEWNTSDKNENEIALRLEQIPPSQVIEIMETFISLHSLYVRHDKKDNLVYTPLLTAAVRRRELMQRRQEEYEIRNQISQEDISSGEFEYEHNRSNQVDDSVRIKSVTRTFNGEIGDNERSCSNEMQDGETSSATLDEPSKIATDVTLENKKEICSKSTNDINKENISHASKSNNFDKINSNTFLKAATNTSDICSNNENNSDEKREFTSSNIVRNEGTEKALILYRTLPRTQAILRNVVNKLIKGWALEESYINKRETYTRYPSLFRIYQPFACHLELVSRADIPPPPDDTLQPKRCTMQMLIKFMALQTIQGGIDGNIMNIIPDDGRQIMKSAGNFADIAQQLPMWFEVRRDIHSSNGSVITYIGGVSDKAHKHVDQAANTTERRDFERYNYNNNSLSYHEEEEESIEQLRKRLGMRRVVNGTLEPVELVDDDENKWDPEWGEEDDKQESELVQEIQN